MVVKKTNNQLVLELLNRSIFLKAEVREWLMDRINKNNFNNEQLVEIISLLGEAEKKQNKIIVKIAQENPNLLQELEKKISGAFSTSWKKAEKNSKDEDEKEEELLFSQI